MNELIGILPRTRHVGAILLLLLAAGCSTWRPLPGAGLAGPANEQLGHAKVFLRDGTEVELRDARVRPDSIVGTIGTSLLGASAGVLFLFLIHGIFLN